MNIKTRETTVCFHCGEDCKSNHIYIQDKQFCCDGCKLVYELLSENNLCTFYDLNKNPGVSQKIRVRKDKFSFLDDFAVHSKLIQFTDGTQTHVTFYLPQMHCSSCLWLLENIHKIQDGVVQSKVNFLKKEVFIVYTNNKTTLRKVVETLTSIGYEPHISLQELESGKIKKTDHSRLYKVGIAGFCFANIMMMSFPEYFSTVDHVEKYIRDVFRFLIVLFSLPVFFYCAEEFFVNARNGFKNKFLNIDAPIALAILITFGRSLYEIFSQTGAGYFDSMSGIVFFMLLGRFLQDKTYQSISFDRDYKSFFPIAVNVIKENQIIPTTVNQIKTGDVIQIYNNELIPVDGILSKGKASVDYSFVSGESLPVIKEIGEIIYAGGKQLEGLIELIVVKEVSQSYLTNLWNKDVFKKKNSTEHHSFIHVVSKYFTVIVLSIAVFAAAYWFSLHQYDKMWNTLTTVLIVACPCALLLSATFTNGSILRILSKNKFYLRHPDVIENLSKINHLVFDKTGTITEQKNIQVKYEGNLQSDVDKLNIASLMSQSAHPLSKAIVDYLDTDKILEITDFKITDGSGVEGWINDKHYKLGSYSFINNKQQIEEKNSNVYVMIDEVIAGNFKIIQKYRFGLNELIDQLKIKFPVSIISGDNNAEQQYLERVFGKAADLLFHQKPEDKFAYVKHLQHIKNKNVLFIGDGLNDAGALKQSNVGITITENANNFTPACDGILDATQFSNLYRFILFAKAGKLIILTSFVISVFYNLIGMYFAVQGSLSPLVAAILMPCSSVSIILITYGLSELAAKKLHLNKHDKNHIMS